MKRATRPDMIRDCPDFAAPKQHRVRDPRNRRAKSPEAPLQAFTDKLLAARGIPFIRVPQEVYDNIFGNPAIPVYVKRWVSENLKGLPDNTCLLPITPRFNIAYCQELKSDIGKQSERQRDWARVTSVVVARSMDEVIAGVDKFVWLAARLKHDLAGAVEKHGL